MCWSDFAGSASLTMNKVGRGGGELTTLLNKDDLTQMILLSLSITLHLSK